MTCSLLLPWDNASEYPIKKNHTLNLLVSTLQSAYEQSIWHDSSSPHSDEYYLKWDKWTGQINRRKFQATTDMLQVKVLFFFSVNDQLQLQMSDQLQINLYLRWHWRYWHFWKHSKIKPLIVNIKKYIFKIQVSEKT